MTSINLSSLSISSTADLSVDPIICTEFGGRFASLNDLLTISFNLCDE